MTRLTSCRDRELEVKLDAERELRRQKRERLLGQKLRRWKSPTKPLTEGEKSRLAAKRLGFGIDTDVVHKGIVQRYSRAEFVLTLKMHLRAEVSVIEEAQAAAARATLDAKKAADRAAEVCASCVCCWDVV